MITAKTHGAEPFPQPVVARKDLLVLVTHHPSMMGKVSPGEGTVPILKPWNWVKSSNPFLSVSQLRTMRVKLPHHCQPKDVLSHKGTTTTSSSGGNVRRPRS
jgi:hypothetical protein